MMLGLIFLIIPLLMIIWYIVFRILLKAEASKLLKNIPKKLEDQVKALDGVKKKK